MRNYVLVRSPAFPATIALGTLALSLSLAAAQNDQPAVQSKDRRPHDYAELAKVPAKSRDRINPLAGDPDAVGAGKKLFDGHCAECHGEAGIGTKKAPSLQADEVQQATPGALFSILTNGVVRRGMPVWSKLPEPQRWQIVSYLKSLGTSDKHE